MTHQEKIIEHIILGHNNCLIDLHMTTLTYESKAPEGLELEVRNKQFQLEQHLASNWLDQDAFKTAFFNALSMTFPDGERFFIDSAKAYSDQIENPKLIADMKCFFSQEAIHSREHRRFNQRLCDIRGYDQQRMEGRTQKMVKLAKRRLSIQNQLAATCGVEHLTAVLADRLLNGWMLDNATPEIGQLWLWHAAEELEHKAVAFDVYSEIGGDYKSRRRALVLFTIHFLRDVMLNTLYMLRKDQQIRKWSTWTSGARFLFGRKGILREMRTQYLEYFDEDFHPWQHDNSHLLASWKQLDKA